MKRFRITETVECCREVFIEAESWTEARDKYADADNLDWKECDPCLSRIDLALMGEEEIEYDFLNVVEQVELTGFEDEDNPVLAEIDKKLKEA
jgi:hypothetical protein